MRKMPTHINVDGESKEIPSIPIVDWFDRLAKIAGRPLTRLEVKLAQKMADHNWTLRIVASELFGEEVTDTHFEPRAT